MKKCSECNVEKELTFFGKRKSSKDGMSYICKSCKSILSKKYEQDNEDERKEYKKEYYLNNKEYFKNYMEKYREENSDLVCESRRKYYLENKDSIMNRARSWKNKNSEKMKKYFKEYNKKYKEENREILNEKKKDRIKKDPLFKLTLNIRCLIIDALKRGFTKKSKKTTDILGCSFEEFYKYLESKFDEHMNWGNQGTYWHLDHIKPISLAKSEKEAYELNHYTNFQPLYWLYNIHKGNKFEG